MDDRAFENILDDCLERLVKGETPEQCLERYPGEATRLEPLLRTAQVAKEALVIHPRFEFKARARYEFQSALREKLAPKKASRLRLMPRWATALLVISVLLLAGGGTAIAASDSMPDSPLYPVKLATEQVQLTLTPSDVGKARLCAELADKRVAEIIYLVSKGDVQKLEVVVDDLDGRLDMLTTLVLPEGVDAAPEAFTGESAVAPAEEAVLAPPLPSSEQVVGEGNGGVAIANGNRAKLRKIVVVYAADHPLALRRVMARCPQSVKSALYRAILVSEAGYQKALKALD